ncbi:MAG: replication endonuclease [Burkholderiales bacterium]
MIDDLWWRRRLRKTHGRGAEQAARRVGLVHYRAGCYVSDLAMGRRRAQRRRIADFFRLQDVVDTSTDECLPLTDVVSHSLANPTVRRAELMTRIAGIEAWAEGEGLDSYFATITCPSAYHAYSKDGTPNPKYEGTTPRAAQGYLCRQWAKIRASLDRKGIECVGIRVAEPHHDGCPHWHLLLWARPVEAETVKAILQRYALEQDGTEPGAAEHRFQWMPIDRTQGSAANYLAKYVAKGTDGAELDRDTEGLPGSVAAERIGTWAATWGIRQFQFFGTPPIGPWRELRRRRDGAPAGPIGDAWRAADMGLFGDYIRVQRQQAVQVARSWDDRPNGYGEPRGWRVVGVQSAGIIFPTRLTQWRMVRRVSPSGGLGNMAITVRANTINQLEGQRTTALKKADFADVTRSQLGSNSGGHMATGPPKEDALGF